MAAVVSLLATENRALVPKMLSAPTATQRLNRSGWRITARYAPITTRAMAVRAPLMAMPPQGISLMHSPPMLYSTAARKTHSVPVRLLFSMRFSPI